MPFSQTYVAGSRERLPLGLSEPPRDGKVSRNLVAHALRTPLSALTLQLEGLAKAIVRSPSSDAQMLARRVDKALQQSWRLAAVVEMLFDPHAIEPIEPGAD